jgi:hypothetical protein
MEDGIVLSDSHRLAKHTLVLILVELKILGILPIQPILLLKEFSPGEFHCCGDVVQHGSIINDAVGRLLL